MGKVHSNLIFIFPDVYKYIFKQICSTSGYIPYPGGGEKWGGNGVGDDLYSYGFDGETSSSISFESRKDRKYNKMTSLFDIWHVG